MKYIYLTAFIIATLIACFALYAGIDHNPMGVFCKNENLDLCEFDYSYALFIWFSWFIPFFLGQVAIIFIIQKIKKFLTNKVRS